MNKQQWLALGIVIEALHLIFAFGVLVFGRMWLPDNIVNLAITVTVMGQVVFLWCPLSVLSSYCFRKWSPNYIVPSLTLYLYRRFGPMVGIPIFLVLVVVSITLGLAI
jgi:hypothetical protein